MHVKSKLIPVCECVCGCKGRGGYKKNEEKFHVVCVYLYGVLCGAFDTAPFTLQPVQTGL